jgi:hypothetical protein
MRNNIRNEQVREASQDILRRATIIGLMRRALDPAPIADDPREPDHVKMARPVKRKPRPIFVLPANARLRRILLNCCIKRA